ncbi:MAG: hypothetical protein P8R54_22910 [Myxococcota bacterium]|nr:hypothetical protein [Myxococcota bacterium]
MERLALLGGLLLIGCGRGSDFEDDDDETAINISNMSGQDNNNYSEVVDDHPDAPQILSADAWCDYVDC